MDFALNKVFTVIENHVNHDKNFATLKRKLKELNAVKEDNESKKIVELQPRKKLKEDVELWFRDVERINGEILDLQNDDGGSNLLSRGFLGGNVLKRIQEVEELLQRGKGYDGLVTDDPQWIGQVLSTTNLVGEAPENLMKEIWAYLMDDGVSKIGVWGMGGVGKTTIMKLIHSQLLQETAKFNTVMWITASKELDIVKLQDHIARAMGKSPLEDDDVTIRAGMIYEMLSRKDKYVLILDDIWGKLSLEEVGIPEPIIGRKLVITTRSLDVCHYLDCREVRVPTLSKQDASSLFLEKVGRDVWSDPVLSPTVEAVIEQCAGLPLAIVTVASSMKGKRGIYEWKNALIELERRAESVNNLNEKVLQRLKFSYERLEAERVKQCFLCCALYPEDFDISKDELIELWIAEGHVEELESMEEEINRGHAILNKLISNCLLENVVEEEDGVTCVKLHDLVRDMALDITTRGKPRFLVRAGMQLKEIPDLKEWAEDLDKVSLMRNWELQIPPQMLPPKCHALTTLLLSQCRIESIPECFFEQMHGLKILDLSGNNFYSLPNSISDLETLSALILSHCSMLENMPSFSKLQALKRLNLEGTKIRELPHGMERLVKLKYLNLSRMSVTKIAAGILSKFSCLQHLELAGIYEQVVSRFVRGDEIGGLRKLEIFKGMFCDLEELSNYAQALYGQTQGPREYYIRVAPRPQFILSDIKCKKRIELGDCHIYRNGAKIPSDIQELVVERCSLEFCEDTLFSRFVPAPRGTFSSLTQIIIFRCRKVKKLFSYDYVLENLQNLEKLKVRDCDEMEEIIASRSELEEEGMDSSSALNLALPKLKELSLQRLPKLKSIYSAKGAMVCDSLQKVEIEDCPKLKRIPLYLPLLEEGQPSPPPSLQNLEVLKVECCDELEEIIASASELEEEGIDSSGNLNLALPKLKELVLRLLSRLKSIYSAKGAMVCDSLKTVSVYSCPKLKRIPLYLPLLEEGRPSPPPSLQNLKVLKVKYCDELEEIIASASELEEEGMDSSSTLSLALPKLKRLSLWKLPKLKSIYSAKGAMVCDSLQTVSIQDCPKLKRIPLYLPLLEEGRPSPPPSLQKLEKFKVQNCDEMEEILAQGSELEEEGMDSSSTLNLAVPKLNKLSLKGLPKLKSIYSAKGAMVCDSLRSVKIEDCAKLQRIPLYLPLLEEGQPSPPHSLQNLEKLKVWDCDEMEEIIASRSELEEEGMDSNITHSLALPKLKRLSLWKLPKLKSIYSAKEAMVCDSLQTVEIFSCPKLQRIPLYLPLLEEGQPSPPPSLQNLEVLKVECCDALEEIIASASKLEEEGMDSSGNLNLALSKLKELVLRHLPRLKSIYSAKGAMVCDSLQTVSVYWCQKLKRIPLYLHLLEEGRPSPPPSLQNLKVLQVKYCLELEEIIASASELEEEGMDSRSNLNLALPKLNKLSLYDLPNLKSIYSAKGAMVCDSLQTVEIYGCQKLQRIPLYLHLLEEGRPSPPPSLQNLEVLNVECCHALEEIIASASELDEEGMDSSSTLNVALPKLRELRLRGLPKLKSIYSAKGAMVCDSLQTVLLDWCPELKRIPLYLHLLEEGRPSPPPSLQNLKVLKVKYCDELEEIIASASELEEEGMDSSSTLSLALPKLKRLSLWKLPKLKSIYSAKGAMVCDSLQTVSIQDCPKLKRIPLYLPLLEEGRPSPPPSLQKLEKFKVQNCDEMEEILAQGSELEEEGMDSSSTLNLALPKLNKLSLKRLPKLKSIYSAKGAMVCDSLRIVWINDCPKLKRIPLYLPLLEEGRPSPPPSLQQIRINRTEWENMKWDHPYAKFVLEPFLSFFESSREEFESSSS